MWVLPDDLGLLKEKIPKKINQFLTFDNFTRKFGALKLRSLVGYHLKIVLYMFCVYAFFFSMWKMIF